MFASSVWLLMAAGMVGFAAAWLVLEVRRAWSPESVRVADRGAIAPADTGELSHLMPALVEEVTNLRREIAAVRAAELEVALRNRQRELQLRHAIEAAHTEATTTPVANVEPEIPEPEIPDETAVAETGTDDHPADLTPGDIASLSVVTSGDRR